MCSEDKVRVIRNYCCGQDIMACYDFNATCKLCWYCDKLYHLPVALWDNDLSGVNNITVEVLYNEIKELQYD